MQENRKIIISKRLKKVKFNNDVDDDFLMGICDKMDNYVIQDRSFPFPITPIITNLYNILHDILLLIKLYDNNYYVIYYYLSIYFHNLSYSTCLC